MSPEEEILAKLDPGQRAAATFHTGSAVVTAVAGAGKTTMIVHRVAHLVQVRKVPADRILVVTFATKGARELETRIAAMLGAPGSFRVGRTPRVGTWHSLAWEIVREHSGQRWTIDDRGKYGTILKQVTGYQGMRWQSVDHDVLQGFIGFCKAHLAAPDSDLAISIAEELHAKTGGSSTDPEKLLEAYERAEAARVTAGLLTFDDQLVEAAKLLVDAAIRERVASRWDFIIQDEAQDQNVAQIAIGTALARDHGNYMLVGDASQCHPAGTRIQVASGHEVPIETLVDGDRVQGWNRNAQRMIGGRAVRVGTRLYTGRMFEVKAGGRSVEMTHDHRLLARWGDRRSRVCVTYLMRREGFGYRVGWCQLFAGRSGGFHLAQRAKLEKADGVWILATHTSRTEASVHESVVAAGFGLPTAVFQPVHGTQHQTEEAIRAIYTNPLVRERNLAAARDCAAHFGCDLALPLWPYERTHITQSDAKYVRGTYFPVRAQNVLPGLMSLPLPDGQNTWAPIEAVSSRRVFDAKVYSLDVEKDHAYAANGVVVLNCIYTWRGAISSSLAIAVRQGATPIRMERTYRCPKRVVARANLVLAALGVPPMVPAREDLGTVTGTVAETGLDEARSITRFIQEHLAGGTKPSDIAVLLRVGDMIQPIEDQLVSAKIPYRVVGGASYFERKEVASLLSYLRIAAGVGTTADVDRTLRAPFRFLSVKTIEAVVAITRQHPELGWEQIVEKAGLLRNPSPSDRAAATLRTWASLLNVITWRRMRAKRADETVEAYADLPGSEVAPEPALRTVVESTRYIEWLQKEDGADTPENNRVKNVQDLLRIAGRFQTAGEFLAYVEKAMKAAAAARSSKAYGDVVTLSTIHRAKGLEWPVVFVGGLVDGMFPHSKADLTEELRLLYVAVTRAKETLYVSGVKGQPSRFRDDDDAPTTPRFLRTLGFSFDEPGVGVPGVRFPYEEVVLPVDRKGVPADPEDEYGRERMVSFDRPDAEDADEGEDEDDLEDPS